MFNLFFIIVFIAEIIIAAKIIEILKQWDKKVCCVNESITSHRPNIYKNLLTAKLSVNKLLLGVTQTKIKLKKKKEQYKIVLIKNLITAICFIILNYNAKRALTIVELLLSLKNVLDTFPKTNNILKV